MMPPIVPARDKQRDGQRDPSTLIPVEEMTTVSTAAVQEMTTVASSYDETTVKQTETTTVTTTESVYDRSTVNPTADTTVPTTASSQKMTESTSMLISAITLTEIASTVSTAATTENKDVIHLEDYHSDTEDDIPSEIPGIEVESSDSDYEDWIPYMRNESTKENTR